MARSKWQPIVFDAVSGNLNTTNSIIQETGINRSTLYYSIIRLLQKDLVEVSKDPKTNRLFITVKNKYRSFKFTLRVLETFKSKKKNKWTDDLDLELTVTGTAPINFNEEMIAEKYTQDLKFKGIEAISENHNVLTGVPIEKIGFEKKGISGVEFLESKSTFDPDNKIESVFTNAYGSVYTARTKIQKRLYEFV